MINVIQDIGLIAHLDGLITVEIEQRNEQVEIPLRGERSEGGFVGEEGLGASAQQRLSEVSRPQPVFVHVVCRDGVTSPVVIQETGGIVTLTRHTANPTGLTVGATSADVRRVTRDEPDPTGGDKGTAIIDIGNVVRIGRPAVPTVGAQFLAITIIEAEVGDEPEVEGVVEGLVGGDEAGGVGELGGGQLVYAGADIAGGNVAGLECRGVHLGGDRVG